MIKIGLLQGIDLYLLLFSVLIFISCFAWSVFFVCCLVVPFWGWNG